MDSYEELTLLTPDFPLGSGLSPQGKVLDSHSAGPVPRVRSERASRRVGEVGASGRVSRAFPLGPPSARG